MSRISGIEIDAVGTLCGEPFMARVVFDPGGLGTYFQTADAVWENREGLKSILRRKPQRVPIFAPASALLETALRTMWQGFVRLVLIHNSPWASREGVRWMTGMQGCGKP